MGRFEKATKKRARARVALIGPTGSGKTYSALAIGTHLGTRVAVIDTERGSASKYAGIFQFDVLELETFSPETYVDAIASAADEGFNVLIVDSLSHAWTGKEGALEQVDRAAARSKSGNSFAAWREVTPMHNQLVDALVGAPMHVIATMRSKTEYVLEKDDRGKSTPRKIGMAPVQRDGIEYEFDVVGDLDYENRLVITKTRCPEFSGAVIKKPGEDVAIKLRAWLTDGAPPALTPAERLAAKLDDATTQIARDALFLELKAAKARLTKPEQRMLGKKLNECDARIAELAAAAGDSAAEPNNDYLSPPTESEAAHG